MRGPLLRAPVVRITQNRWFRSLATGSRIGHAVASRFVAGETLDDAIDVALELARAGIATMFDHLGENVAAPEQATEAANAYLRALTRIREAERLDCAVSIKLSQLGLDFSTELCLSHVEHVLAAADEAGTLVMIDMEGHAYVDRTLALFRDLRTRHERVGVCLQSYLRRSPEDVTGLPEGSIVRLVKGAYLEPPEVAYARRREVDAAYARLFVTLVARGHTVHLATHDPKLIAGARRHIEGGRVPRPNVEFQMLYGIRQDLQSRLTSEGLPVRVYVPYGSEWFPYLTRRLAERPANLWFFLSNLARSRR